MKIRFKLPEKFETVWALFMLTVLTFLLQGIVFKHLVGNQVLMPWLLFFSFLLFLRPYASAILVFLIEALLSRIHLMKLSLTNTPLDASDLLGWRQAVFLKSYTDILIPVLAFGMVVCIVKGFSMKKRQYVFLPIFILLTASCVQESRPTEVKTNPVNFLFRLARVNYVDWNLVTNVKENGILNHMFLTLPKGDIPPKGKVPYDDYRTPALTKDDSDRPDVFLILCESCYSSSGDSFVTPISRLEQEGYSHATVISPVYGGMTAEAEYEVLTGLPSRRYKGIDFQYFAEKYAKEARAVPRVFAQNGYETFSAHNNGGYYWKREIVHPKFGFNKSLFYEDKQWGARATPPEDGLLFSKALKQYSDNLQAGKKTFSFLITIYSHGPYAETNGDGGEAVYKQRLEKTTQDILAFEKAASELAKLNNRPVVFVLFGDHKPAMTIAFYKKHEFDDDFFIAKGDKSESFLFANLNRTQQLVFGRVPLYVKTAGTKDNALAQTLAADMENRPLFCLPGLLSQSVGIQEAFYKYTSEVCQRDAEELVDPRSLRSLFPEEIYGNRLF
ncbi:LTA synthase family protein [Bdellovibrio bacteriovorus]|uniref:LTA synthase family protein n=1 Tax=Bdellovibrio bacteriovorus TaxID=959 RepID=UPI0035A6B442